MKNSYSYPDYSRRVLEAADALREDKSFLSMIEQQAGTFYVATNKMSWLTKLLLRCGILRQHRTYTRDAMDRVYSAALLDMRSAVSNAMLKKPAKTTYCTLHQRPVKACPCQI